MGIEVERGEGEIGNRALTGRLPLHIDKPDGLQGGGQLMEVPQPVMPLAHSRQADVLCLEGRRQQLQHGSDPRPRQNLPAPAGQVAHPPKFVPRTTGAARSSPVRSCTKAIMATRSGDGLYLRNW